MSVENHLGLPEEVFETILQHLDLRGVLSCSLVCLGWRNAVNSDHVWKVLCKKIIPEERLKLRTEDKRVGSSYEVFESVNLPRLCFWRVRYMDDINLKRNWKNLCFQEDFIMELNGDFSDWQDSLVTDNELLLVPKSSRSSPHTVFNIVNNPIMTGEIRPALEDYEPELFKLYNNILVIVQHSLFQVYVKDEDKNLNFKFFALFDKNHWEKTVPDTEFLLRNSTHTTHDTTLFDTYFVRCDHNGKYLVGMYANTWLPLSQCWYSPLYIWDLEYQTKVQEVDFPWRMPEEQLSKASFFLRDNIIHIVLRLVDCISIYSYDIDKSSYSETVLRLEVRLVSSLFTGTVVFTESPTEEKFVLFDLRDGRILDTLKNRDRTGANSVQAFGNFIAFAEPGYCEKLPIVTVYDTEKLCLVDRYEVASKDGYISSFHIVMDDLMVISTGEQLLIRDFKKGEILRTVECINFLPPEPSCSKVVVLKPGPPQKLVVLHFW